MEVYIEDIFLDNFIIDFLILFLVNKLLHKNSKTLRLIFASIIGVVFTILNIIIALNGILLLTYKLGIGLIIVLIAFKDFKPLKILLNYITFLFSTAIMGGLCFFVCFSFGKITLTNETINYELGIPVSIVLLIICISIYFAIKVLEKIKTNAKNSNFIYKAKFCDHNHQIEINAFLDSGNSLIDPLTQKPVTIITYNNFKRIFKNALLYDLLLKRVPKFLKNAHYISANTIHQKNEILVFTIENLHLTQNKQKYHIKNAVIGLSFADFESTLNCGLLLNPIILNGENYE